MLLLLVVVVLLFGIGSVLYKNSQSVTSTTGLRSAQMSARFDKIETAILVFAQSNLRLPCPADPTDNAGGLGSAGVATCPTLDGVLPWGALGISLEDSLDSWGRKISYRVYSGSTGFTQTNGLNATDCNSPPPPAVAVTPLTSAGLCDPTHGTPQTAFLPGKGLFVDDFGTNKTGVAYVLISHGATGYGSYGIDAASPRSTMPNVASMEYANASVPMDNTYHVLAASGNTIDASAPTHFDDLLRYRLAADLIKQAGLDARVWP